jgi:hypothetical protein
MKKLLLLLALLPSLALAQMTTVNPDTVCYQTGGSVYSVQATAGLIYNWTVVAPGVITGGQGTNQIQVDWSAAAPGLISNAVQVQSVNAIGCLSPIVTLDVFIFDLTPVLSLIGDMCENGGSVQLIANPPGGTWSGTGVAVDQFCPTASGAGNFVITYEFIYAGCSFVNAMSVNVLPIPMLLPIQHN